jgi:Domain of unknown function (DUF4172)
MATYIHQNPDWPSFTWNQAQLTELLTAVRHRQGRLLGRMESLGFSLRKEAVLETLTQDVLKSSEIEGEFLNRTCRGGRWLLDSQTCYRHSCRQGGNPYLIELSQPAGGGRKTPFARSKVSPLMEL